VFSQTISASLLFNALFLIEFGIIILLSAKKSTTMLKNNSHKNQWVWKKEKKIPGKL